MNYYKVSPLARLSNNDGLLTYSFIHELSVGDIVLVPLRSGSKTAVVISKEEKPLFKTKEITKKLSDDIVIDAAHLKLATFIKEHYYCTLGEALSTILPVDLTKNRRNISSKNTPIKEKTVSPVLTTGQEEIVANIRKNGTTKPYLLFGVTGSGKTEIYMSIIADVLSKGKGAIVLVPEISLTPQTEQRFRDRFGEIVGVTHSNLKETEKYKLWQEIAEGTKRVIIGPRSALFAPLADIGAIIIDEAHESSYKQDQTPRYQTIPVATELAALTDSYLILGTATPTVEQYYGAENGKYNLLSLNKRIMQSVMPEVEIVDMRNEYHYRNFSIFSEKLQEAIKVSLANKRQVLLFINRRGMSTFVSCRECGYVENCENCDIPFTYHYTSNNLRCHHCGSTNTPPVKCPKCNSIAIKFFGVGTERVEAEIIKLFGDKVTLLRMDSDTTSGVGSHERMFKEISDGKPHIIIGTQMVAKGWDISNIDLVGIISADAMLNMADYEAESRAYSLMLQVAGRVGRGNTRGKVIIQTYNPERSVFTSILDHDYLEFYKEEIKSRKELLYPPFANIIELLYNNVSNDAAETESRKVAKSLKEKFAENNIDITVIGPAPAILARVRNKYRWQIILKVNTNHSKIYNTLNNIFEQTLINDWIINSEPNGI